MSIGRDGEPQGEIDRMSDDELMEYLSANYGWKFESSAHINVPKISNDYGCARELALLKDFLVDKYYIHDQFSDDPTAHSERRKFNRQLGGFAERKSKMRGNGLLSVLVLMQDVISSVQSLKPELGQKLAEAFERLDPAQINNYNQMSYAVKVYFVRQIDDAIFSFFQIIALFDSA